MNPDTGHIVAMMYGDLPPQGYVPVPDGRLSRRAERLLNGRPGVYVTQADPLTRAMKRVRSLRKKAEKAARKRSR